MENRKDTTAILLNLGTELVQGFVPNSNASWCSERLRQLGFRQLWQATLPDEPSAFARQFSLAREMRPDLILITGGLGPTDDDRTRQLVASILGLELVHSSSAEEGIRAFLSRHDYPWHDNNRIQAMFPQGASVLSNSAGSAPGFSVSVKGCRVVCLPGVPHEMRRMFDLHLPVLFPSLRPQLEHLDALFAGLGESIIGQALRQVAPDGGWCSLPSAEGVLVRLYRESDGPQASLEGRLQRLLAVLGPTGDSALVSIDGSGLAQVVVRHLQNIGHTLAVAESCTGGMLGQAVTAVSGSSAVFWGGVVAYQNEVKRDLLGVPWDLLQKYGAVSEEVARAMASGARRALGSNWGLATTGIAGPGGGSPEKPVGTVWMAVDGPGVQIAFREIFSGDRDEIRAQTVYRLLDALRVASRRTQKITCTVEQ
ncbi:MAG TPA: nicotinamide-nucleotide amidohydrolase family protein [Fibrobacteraceae bacterium]|nr:nicotinamide-nucleotide amidohydrolase family protein [Fibrobacteraceae bacterium]